MLLLVLGTFFYNHEIIFFRWLSNCQNNLFATFGARLAFNRFDTHLRAYPAIFFFGHIYVRCYQHKANKKF